MEFNRKKAKTIFSIAAGTVFLYWALQHYEMLLSALSGLISLTSPLLIGFCIAFVLGVPLGFLERHFFPKAKARFVSRARRPICILLSLFTIGAIITAVISLVVPELFGAFSILAKNVPVFFEELMQRALAQAGDIPALESWLLSLNIPWQDLSKTIFDFIKNGATGLLGGTVTMLSGIFNGVFNMVVAFIFALYILLNKEKLSSQLKRILQAYLPEKRTATVLEIAKFSSNTFAHFISGQCIEACILGSLCWLGMLLFRFPYAPMVGALVGITALIPIIGAFVGTVVGGFMIFMIDPIQALWFVIFLLVLQQIEGNVIYPRVVGSSVGLPAMWVLAAVTVGGGLFGIVGMLFAVPTFSIVYTLLRRNVNKRLVEKQEADASVSCE
ncbi:MAG: AI-2E family transporter [Oscillospiraceae bacterium]